MRQRLGTTFSGWRRSGGPSVADLHKGAPARGIAAQVHGGIRMRVHSYIGNYQKVLISYAMKRGTIFSRNRSP